MSTEHSPRAVVDVSCRRFEAPTTGGGVRKRAALWAGRDVRGIASPS